MLNIKKTLLEALIEHLVYLASIEENDTFREAYLGFAMRLADMRRAGKGGFDFNEAA